MSAEASVAMRSDWSRASAFVLPVTILGAILVFIVPLPPVVLDMLLAANVMLAVLVLLTVLAIRSPQDFSALPTVLLTTTLSRLVLNVASTRLILTRGGTNGLEAAGGVIRAFGEFVAGDEVVVGAVIFAILVVIQFVVITKGATRISEVAARFMLDGLPGRQMAIDADLHAGLIDQAEAGRRRDAVYRQADFFGAMDGAGKFVRGDAIAGIIITCVNIIGGLYMGMVVNGLEFGEAVGLFTKLTIGDGLASQMPAFLISLAAGLVVTRSSSDSDLGGEVTRQLFGRPIVLLIAGCFSAMLAFTALPMLPLLAIAAALTGAGVFQIRRIPQARTRQPVASDRSLPVENRRRLVPQSNPGSLPVQTIAPEPELAAEGIDELLQVNPLELEIGYRLISLTERDRGGNLLDRMREVRQQVARELGLIVPQVRIRDEVGLGPHQYRVKIRGAVVGQGVAYAGRLLAIPTNGLLERPDGRDGVDPVTGQPAVWIHAEGRGVAELAGCRVLEADAVMASHFGEIVRDHADELVTHEQVRMLLDRLRATSPGLVDEVVPTLLRPGELRRLLQNLVRERVSIRDIEAILESLAEHGGEHQGLDALTELVRQSLGRQLVQPYLESDGRLRVVNLARILESRLEQAARNHESRLASSLGRDTARGLVRAVAIAVSSLIEAGHPPVVLASSESRAALKDLTRADLPRLAVLCPQEIPRDVPLEILGSVVEEEMPTVTSVSTTVA
jgi:flagellar biosynthesis protein FlhA